MPPVSALTAPLFCDIIFSRFNVIPVTIQTFNNVFISTVTKYCHCCKLKTYALVSSVNSVLIYGLYTQR